MAGRKKTARRKQTANPKPPAGEPQQAAQEPQAPVPADGTLLRQDGDPLVYVMAGGKRRPVVSADAFLACGFEWSLIRVLSGAQVRTIPIGEEVANPSDLQGEA